MEFVSGLSGATLGYIHGNTRGAIKGWSAGRKLYQNKQHMPPINRRTPTPRSRRSQRRVSVSGFPTPSTRSRAGSSTMSRRSSLAASTASSGSNFSNSSEGNVRDVKRTVKRKKGVTFKKAKRVKVSKDFREKVKKTLSSSLMYGVYEDVQYGAMQPTVNNIQLVHTFNQASTGVNFDPIYVLSCASSLFNNKTPVQDPTLGDANNFDPTKTKIEVVESYSVYRFKNNSTYQVEIDFYQCAPKIVSDTISPTDTWDDALITDTLAAPESGPNVIGNDKTVMFMRPTTTKGWNKYWKATVTKLIMEPGQSTEISVAGPKGVEYDFNKFYKDGVFQINQKMARVCFAVVRNCLGSATLATVGRYGAVGLAATQVIYEVKRFTKIRMPDETGFQYPAVFAGSTMQKNNRRRDGYIMRNWAVALAGVQEMVVEVNPTVVYTPA